MSSRIPHVWLSEPWAARLYDWANLALIVALTLGVVATIGVVWMGNVKEEYLKRSLAATTERAAIAEKSAAEANKKAEEERLARARIEEKLAGWKLGATAQARVIEALKDHKGTPYDLGANPNEVTFMETLDSLLLASGWRRLTPKAISGSGVDVLLNGKARINYVTGIYVEVAPNGGDPREYDRQGVESA